MGDVMVDIVGSEPFQALFDLMPDGRGAEITVNRLAILMEEIGTVIHMPDKPAFGDQHHLVTPAGNCLADDGFRKPHAIGRCGIDEGNSRIDGGLYGGDGLPLVGATPHPATDGPGAKPHGGCADGAAADRPGQYCIVCHEVSPPS
ncbi:hypothetical protein D3C78_677040 [compost metagenome]